MSADFGGLRLRLLAAVLSCLADMAFCGEPEPPEEKSLRMELTREALGGNAQACFRLGRFYEMRSDSYQAGLWLQKGRAQKDIPSTWALARLSEGAGGEKPDHELARSCYLDLIAMKVQGAAIRLARLYDNPSSPIRDPARAVLYYQDAAAEGDVEAMLALAKLFLRGLEPGRCEYELALKWFHEAAGKGSSEAMRSLGMFYRFGLGTDPDHDKGWMWYNRAAEAGDAESYFIMAEALSKGDQVGRNPDAARIFYEKAAKLGHREALKKLGLKQE